MTSTGANAVAARHFYRYELPRTAPQFDLLESLIGPRWTCVTPGSDSYSPA